MDYKNLVSSFVRSWNFTRSETQELLSALQDDQLQFYPQGNKWQALYYQFGCLGRTQIVYTQAIITGTMDFSLFSADYLPKKTDFQTKVGLEKFLEKTNFEWIQAIRTKRRDEGFFIKWPGFRKTLMNHILSLCEHERLHHGQLISYFTLATIALPEKFKENWAL